jgi:predicted TIM-barrel fold metal-dependent hydrolase
MLTTYRIIDADGHVVEPDNALDSYLEESYREYTPRRVQVPKDEPRWLIEGRLVPKPSGRGRGFDWGHLQRDWSSQGRLRDMDIEGVDIAVLFPSMGLFFGGIEEPRLAVSLCRAYNDWLADYIKTDPIRLKPAALLPLHDPHAAAQELERTVTKFGAVGGVISTNLHGKNLDHPDFYVIYEAAEALDVPLLVHSGAGANPPPAGSDRFDNFFFTHLVAHPFEQMIALASVAAGGVLERFQTLRFAFMESGCGWIPYWLERLDEHYEKRANLVPTIKAKPSEYVLSGRVYFTFEPEERTLPDVIRHIGDDILMYASDYPHWDCIFPESARTILKRDDISELTKRKLLHDNASRFYKLANNK